LYRLQTKNQQRDSFLIVTGPYRPSYIEGSDGVTTAVTQESSTIWQNYFFSFPVH